MGLRIITCKLSLKHIYTLFLVTYDLIFGKLCKKMLIQNLGYAVATFSTFFTK